MALNVAVTKDYGVVVIDVVSAFLEAEYPQDEPLYVKITAQIAPLLVRNRPDFSKFRAGDGTMICRVKKALYGFRDSPRLWYDKLRSILEGMGFVRTTADLGLFIRQVPGGIHVLVLHVDDMVTLGPLRARNELVEHEAYLDICEVVVGKNDSPLDGEAKKRFFSLVAKVMYLCNHVRGDCRFVAAWLTTRQVSPLIADWDTLRALSMFLRAIPHRALCF
jgi:hypothetical protein